MKKFKIISLIIIIIMLTSALLTSCVIDKSKIVEVRNNINLEKVDDLKIMFGENKLYPISSTANLFSVYSSKDNDLYKLSEAYYKNKKIKYIPNLISASWQDVSMGFVVLVTIKKDVALVFLEETKTTLVETYKINEIDCYQYEDSDFYCEWQYGNDLYTVLIDIPNGFNNVIDKAPVHNAIKTYTDLFLNKKV